MTRWIRSAVLALAAATAVTTAFAQAKPAKLKLGMATFLSGPAAYPFAVIEGLTIFPGEMVQNPVGTKSPEWVKTLKPELLKDARITAF